VKAILYARVSTRGQAEKGYSLRQQTEALRSHTEANGMKVLAVVTDDGYSGMTLDRPGLDKVRELVEAGGVDVVLAQDRDRFAREPAFHYLLETEFGKHGTKLTAINDWGGDSPEGQLLRGIQDQVAKYERVLITERTRRGKLRRAKEGKVVPAGTPPYGFAYDSATGNYRIDEATMPVVRRIFKLYGVEGHSLHQVKRALEADGIRTAGTTKNPGGSKYWNVSNIRRIILHDVYKPHTYQEIEPLVSPDVATKLVPNKLYGISWYNRRGGVTNEKGRRTRGAEKPREDHIAVPIPDSGIPRGWVDSARSRLKDSSRPSKADNKFWELSGHAFCACGRKLVSRVTGGQGHRYHYYVCSRYARDGKEACPHGGWWNAQKLERRVFRALSEVAGTPDLVREQFQDWIDEERSKLRDLERDVSGWCMQLDDAARRREKYQEMFAAEAMSLDELKTKLAELDQRKAVVERELDRATNSEQRIGELERLQAGTLTGWLAIQEAKGEEILRDFYRDTQLKVVTDGKEVEITWVGGKVDSQNVAPVSTLVTRR